MGEVKIITNLFLRCMSAVYLCAFASIYVQIPGLYGDNGILPVRNVLPGEPLSWSDFHRLPTLLRFVNRFGLEPVTGLELLCLTGVLVAFLAFIFQWLRNCIVFFILWNFYLSVFHIGQTFLWFQWDILLLEIGLLSAIVAPLPSCRLLNRSLLFHCHDGITIWLVKWLTFRLMFSSGAVKLSSGCPTWWELTALSFHYETQCIPTPLAWYAHQLPVWFQKMSVASTLIIQLVLPFMFFLPSTKYRSFSAFGQVLLMVLIILTGNYNFFNWLTIILCLSLLDDEWIISWCVGRSAKSDHLKSILGEKCIQLLDWLFPALLFGSLVYVGIEYFSFHFSWKDLHIESALAFTMSDFEQFLQSVVPISIWIGLTSLLSEICFSIFRCFTMENWIAHKVTNAVGCIVFGTLALGVFLHSLVPYTVIHQSTHDQLPSVVKQWHSVLHEFHVTNSYGLFRRMTGVGGRPEVIIEGSMSNEDGWKEYEFLYKPGDVNKRPPFVAPHQPRLDWQMWFAALGSYQHNPWFLNFVYRLLTNESSVLQLIDKNPFPSQPPQYIRANLYHYHYASPGGSCHKMNAKEATKSGWSKVNNRSWWCRRFEREYLPVVWTTEPNFVSYLKSARIYNNANSAHEAEPDVKIVVAAVKCIRSIVGQADGFNTCILLLSLAVLVTLITKAIVLYHNAPNTTSELTAKKTK